MDFPAAGRRPSISQSREGARKKDEHITVQTAIPQQQLKTRVLVCGADTYVGRSLCKRLAQAAHEHAQSLAAAANAHPEALSVDGVASSPADAAISNLSQQPQLFQHPLSVSGTLSGNQNAQFASSSDIASSLHLDEIVTPDTLKTAILSADYIFFDVLQSADEAMFATKVLSQANVVSPKVLVLLSSIMCWSNTDLSSDFLSEDAFATRRPHPQFSYLLQAEKAIRNLSRQKTLIDSYVLFAGLTYGEGENIFAPYFRQAWCGRPSYSLPLLGTGSNVPRTIHVKDLANIAFQIAFKHRPVRSKYVFAVDEGQSTLRDIMDAISQRIGTGAPLEELSDDDSLLIENADQLTSNIPIQADVLPELGITLEFSKGFVEHIDAALTEFQHTQGLDPLRILVSGPPTSGRTTLARNLSTFYRLPLLQVSSGVIGEFFAAEETAIKSSPDSAKFYQEIKSTRIAPTPIPPTIPPKASKADKERIEKEWAAEQAALAANINYATSEYPPETAERIFKWKITNNRDSRLYGYVLDGYPSSAAQGQSLFGPVYGFGAAEGQHLEQLNRSIVPEVAISLGAADIVSSLRERMQALEDESKREQQISALQAYAQAIESNSDISAYLKAVNAPPPKPVVEDATPSAVEEDEEEQEEILGAVEETPAIQNPEEAQDDASAEPVVVKPVIRVLEIPSNLWSQGAESILSVIVTEVGAPRNYGPSEEEIREQQRAAAQREAEELAAQQREQEEQQQREAADRAEKERIEAEHRARAEALKREEEAVLEKYSAPHKAFLHQKALSVLAPAYLELLKAKPENPSQWLIQWLLKNDPSNLAK